MAVTTKKLFPATSNSSTTDFSLSGLQLNNQDDLDVYVTKTTAGIAANNNKRILHFRQSTSSNVDANHNQVNNTDGLYFPAITHTGGTETLENYTLVSNNSVVRFNSALPNGAIVFVERRTRDADSAYTSFASGSTIRATDLNNSSTESNFTAQEARNKALTIEGVLFRGDQPSTNFVTTDHIVAGTIVTNDIANDSVNADKIPDDTINSEHYVDQSIDTQHIANLNVTTAKIDNQAVTTGKIADLNVTRDKLEADAIDSSKLADNAVNSEHYVDGSIDHVHLANDIIDGDNIQDDVINSEHIATGALDNEHYAAGSITADKLNAATVITASEQGTATTNDTSFLTSAAADARFFNISSGDTIKDGQTFPDNDTTIATTAAINDRIIDIVNDVGGFDIVESEQHFPNTNPQGQAGSAAVLSIKAASTNLVPSGTTLTISNGNLANNANITITGVTSTIPSGFGFIVESTSTLHTYTFHRLVPKATEVTTVAGIAGNVTTVAGISANTTTVAGISSDVTTVAGIASNVTSVANNTSNINSAVSNASNINSAVSNASNINTVAGSISNVNSVAGSITSVNTAASNLTAINKFGDTYQVAASNPSTDGGGNAVAAGDLYFNTSANRLKVYDGANWVDGVIASGGGAQTTGDTFTGDLKLNDNVKLLVGTGSDLEVFHHATNGSFINDAGTSTLKLQTGGVTKLEIQSSGIGVTGNITISGTVDGRDVAADGNSLDNIEAGNIGTDVTNGNIKLAPNGTGVVEVRGAGGNDGTLQLNCSAQSHGIKLKSPPHSAAQSYTLTFPSSIVNNGFLKTDSSGNLSFAAVNTDLLNDTSPQLGGDLQSNGNDINFADNDKTVFGTGGDLEIYHSGNGSFIKEAGTGPLQILTNHLHVKNAANNENIFEASENSSVKLYHDNSLKFFTISGGVQAANRIIVGEGTAQRGVLSGDANSVSIGSISDIPLNFNRNSQTKARIDGNDFQIPNDNGKIELGADQDLQIYHNGTNATIDTSTGELQLASDAVMRFQATEYKFNNAANSEKIANFFQDGACELYHNHSKKFETTSSGISVTGQITATDTINTTGNLDMSDSSGTGNNRIRLGNSDDLEIYQDGSNSVVRESGTGQLQLESNTNIVLGTEGIGETYLKAVPNGAVELYHNNTKRFETQSGGAAVTGGLNVSGDTKVPDNSKFIAGTGDDLQIYHDGSNSFIKDAGTGNLFIHSSQLDILNNVASAYMLRCISGGSVELFEAGSKKFETTNVGTQVTGQIETVSTPNADPYAGFIARSSGGNNHCGFFADAATGANAQTHIRFGYSGSPKWQWRVPWHAEGASAGMMLYDYSVGDDVLKISQGGNQSIKGHVSPRSNNSYDLGTSATRWRNIYTNDLNLSNEGSSNDMDGSWGDWTIQEGESDLFLKNNRSGKKYKFNLTEVS